MIGNATLPVPSNDCAESVVASPLTVKFLELASAVAVAEFPVELPALPLTLPVIFATRVATPYPVAVVSTVVEGTVCVSVNNLNVLSVDASKNIPPYLVVPPSTYLP